MNQPMPPGTALDQLRFNAWLASFAAYSDPVTQPKIENWLNQYAASDRDLAARVLDAVRFFGHQHIRTTYRDLLAAIPGWNYDAAQRTGRWVFVPFSGSVGESGDSMMHIFRMATGMTQKKYKDLFAHRSELVSMKLTDADTVVLVDDFSATGTQVRDSWREAFAEFFALGPRVYLMLVAATDEAVKVIREETDMEVTCGSVLDNRHRFFQAQCTAFSPNDKDALLRYCRRASPRQPRGWGDAGLLVVFAHRCPNNSLPILHAANQRWAPLFPRNLA